MTEAKFKEGDEVVVTHSTSFPFLDGLRGKVAKVYTYPNLGHAEYTVDFIDRVNAPSMFLDPQNGWGVQEDNLELAPQKKIEVGSWVVDKTNGREGEVLRVVEQNKTWQGKPYAFVQFELDFTLMGSPVWMNVLELTDWVVTDVDEG